MSYFVTNGKNYLAQSLQKGVFSTTILTEALKFEDKTKAQNFINNLPKSIKNLHYFIQEEQKTADVTTPIQSPYPWLLDEAEETVQNFQELIQNIGALKDMYKAKMDNADKEIMDIEHAAEFFSLNAAQGYKLYKMLHEARIERREAKDALLKLTILTESTIQDYADGRPLARLKGMEDRIYAPRILKELFE